MICTCRPWDGHEFKWSDLDLQWIQGNDIEASGHNKNRHKKGRDLTPCPDASSSLPDVTAPEDPRSRR